MPIEATRAGLGEPVGVADRGVLDCRRREWWTSPGDGRGRRGRGSTAPSPARPAAARWASCAAVRHPTIAPGVHVGDERGEHHARPGRHVGEVDHPQLVRAGGGEVPIDQVRRAAAAAGSGRVVRERRGRGARPRSPARASAARPCSGPPATVRGRSRRSWCHILRAPSGPGRASVARSTRLIIAASTPRRATARAEAVGSWRRSRWTGRSGTPCSVSTRQIGSTPNRSSWSSMNVDHHRQSRVGEVGPGRGASLSTGPFPRAASRTRRAPFNAPGSPQAPFRSAWFSASVVGQGDGMIDPR